MGDRPILVKIRKGGGDSPLLITAYSRRVNDLESSALAAFLLVVCRNDSDSTSSLRLRHAMASRCLRRLVA